MYILSFLLAVTFGAGARAQDISKHDSTYTKVEIEAQYPGGDIAWLRFLNHNLHYPADSVDNEFQGAVTLQFIVDTAGNVSDIQVISGPKMGVLSLEAIRVVKASGKWIPAKRNGVKVRSYKRLPISIKLEKV